MNADKPIIIINNGDNNKVSFGEKHSSLPCAIIALAVALIVLAISLSCPELLANIIRWIFGMAIKLS